MERSACGPRTEHLFVQLNGETPKEKTERERQAKEVCGQCAVRLACLDYAMNSGLVDSKDDFVWGGLTLKERRKRRGARRAG